MQIDDWNKLMSDTIIEKQMSGINTDEVELIPCNVGVIVKPYEENPYRMIEKTASGFILGVQSNQKQISDESGEMEENEEYITCAKVIAVGPFTKNVKVGEDVFVVKHILKPIPFRKQGLWELDEQNILCRIVPKGSKN